MVLLANLKEGRDDVILRRRDGSDVRQITFPVAPFSDARPAVSPDGKRIVFNRQDGETIGIFVVTFDAQASSR